MVWCRGGRSGSSSSSSSTSCRSSACSSASCTLLVRERNTAFVVVVGVGAGAGAGAAAHQRPARCWCGKRNTAFPCASDVVLFVCCCFYCSCYVLVVAVAAVAAAAAAGSLRETPPFLALLLLLCQKTDALPLVGAAVGPVLIFTLIAMIPIFGFSQVRPTPTSWTILEQHGPNHLGMRYNAHPTASNGPNHLGPRALTAMTPFFGFLPGLSRCLRRHHSRTQSMQ